MPRLDDDGQPIIRFSTQRVADRTIDEMIGLCRGIACDGRVVQAEAQFLLNWMEQNIDVREQWPGTVLYPRIAECLLDDHLDQEEATELYELLNSITGEGQGLPCTATSTLPFDSPLPSIDFPGRKFVVTGKFAFGPRRICLSEIEARSGIIQSTPSRKTDYLIVGIAGSRDWIHSSHGRKIEAAIQLREQGYNISIVPEEHFAEALVAVR